MLILFLGCIVTGLTTALDGSENGQTQGGHISFCSGTLVFVETSISIDSMFLRVLLCSKCFY